MGMGLRLLGRPQSPHPCSPLVATPLDLDSPLHSSNHPAPASTPLGTGGQQIKVKFPSDTPEGPWASHVPSSLSHRARAIHRPWATVRSGARGHMLGAFGTEPRTQENLRAG